MKYKIYYFLIIIPLSFLSLSSLMTTAKAADNTVEISLVVPDICYVEVPAGSKVITFEPAADDLTQKTEITKDIHFLIHNNNEDNLNKASSQNLYGLLNMGQHDVDDQSYLTTDKSPHKIPYSISEKFKSVVKASDYIDELLTISVKTSDIKSAPADTYSDTLTITLNGGTCSITRT